MALNLRERQYHLQMDILKPLHISVYFKVSLSIKFDVSKSQISPYLDKFPKLGTLAVVKMILPYLQFYCQT